MTDPLSGVQDILRKHIVKHAENLSHTLTFTVCDAVLEAVEKRVAKETKICCNYTLTSELRVFVDLHVSGDCYSSGPPVPLSKVLLYYIKEDRDEPVRALRRTLAIVEKALVEREKEIALSLEPTR
ncbi:hypothetical protein UFOVP468_34 [uncultured Caudovirales phage]|uniref:Uncharacterized protein n=1 Tax=uncultured Caudovirales phage TaxID=2100421 RepID=A0A6J5MCU4_9CAUD|nr:hypothetical protein UFOVP468_34 [uncultured Caudovirales phage]